MTILLTITSLTVVALAILTVGLVWDLASGSVGWQRSALIAAGVALIPLFLVIDALVLATIGLHGVFVDHIAGGWGWKAIGYHLVGSLCAAQLGWRHGRKTTQ